MSFDSPFSLGGAVAHFGQPPGEVAFGSKIRAEREGENPSKSRLGTKAWLLDHDSGSSLIHLTTGRGNGREDTEETALQQTEKATRISA